MVVDDNKLYCSSPVTELFKGTFSKVVGHHRCVLYGEWSESVEELIYHSVCQKVHGVKRTSYPFPR